MKKFLSLVSGLVIVLCSHVESAKASDAEIRNFILQNPEIIAEALQKYEQQQREKREGQAAELHIIYAQDIMSHEGVPFIGPEDAKVTVTEFFDFSCGYCKKLSPEIEKIIADNADVKFVFKPLTFVSPVSGYQAKASFAAFNQGKFLEFYKGVLQGNANSEELVDEIAGNAGVDMEKYKADIKSEEINRHISDVSSFAQKIQVNGVPTVFINGKQVNGRSAAELQAAIDEAIDDVAKNILLDKKQLLKFLNEQ